MRNRTEIKIFKQCTSVPAMPCGGEDTHGNSFHHTQEIVEDAAFCWLGPIFFFLLGGKIVIEADVCT